MVLISRVGIFGQFCKTGFETPHRQLRGRFWIWVMFGMVYVVRFAWYCWFCFVLFVLIWFDLVWFAWCGVVWFGWFDLVWYGLFGLHGGVWLG